MARSSFNQSSFLGGEWNPISQGRSDDPRYMTAMNVCMNGVVTEEGAVPRRSGTMWIGPTRRRSFAKLLPFDGSDTCSFGMEFTDTHLRFFTQSSLVCDDVAPTITASDPATGHITLSTAVGSWQSGDGLLLVFPDPSSLLFPFPQSLEVGLRNRLLVVGAMFSSTIVILSDDLGNLIDTTAWPAGALVGCQLLHVTEFTTPYTGIPQLDTLRSVQDEYQSIILSSTAAPRVVQVTAEGTATTDPHFSFGALTMIDGPYQDPQTQTLTLSARSGSVTATAGSAVFTTTKDVGRLIRIFTQPAVWASGTTYASGDLVTDAQGAWWQSLAGSNTGNTPGTAPLVAGVATVWWAPAPTAGSWAWGTITAVTSTTVATVLLDATIPGMTLQAANPLTATTWQLGVYSITTGYPTCGGYHEGRLWLGGVVLNRFDTTVSNGVVLGKATFSPTDPYGNVLDNSGISEVLNSKGLNQIQWFMPDHSGMVMGTINAEFQVSASAQNDPITPTDIQQHEVTKYGSLNIEPRRAGMAIIFVQKYGRRILEFIADAFSGKQTGRHLNEFAKHMTRSGVAEIAYQEEPVPIVWARMKNGLLAGATYRRFSRFVSQPPEVQAWHWHPHGGMRVYTSMAMVPGKAGLLDRLFLVSQDAHISSQPDPIPENYYVEIMQPIAEPDATLPQGWWCDQAPGPGPGNSNYTCGGGQAATLPVSGALSATDSSVAVMPASGLPAAGGVAASPPAGGLLKLVNAAYFPGSVMLFNLPKFPGGTPPSATVADQHSLSMSVWLGVADFPLTAGALFSSPALSFAETNGLAKVVSGLLSGAIGTGSISNSATLAFIGPNGYPTTCRQKLDLSTVPGGRVWYHLMVSAKDNGAGHLIVTCAVNDTVILNNVDAGPYTASAADMWPFATQKDGIKDNGLSLFAIGGSDVSTPLYNLHTSIVTGPPTTIVIPSISDFLRGTVGGRNQAVSPAPAPYFGDQARTIVIQHEYPKVTSGSGGPGNGPSISSVGGYAGYRGSVAELWIQPGSFIDWTLSANRYKFHEYDSVSDAWGPVDLGASGQSTGFGAAWIYCSGGPLVFPLNRANGKWLAGGGGGFTQTLLTSALNFPR